MSVTHVFLERNFAQPVTLGFVKELASNAAGCFDLHRVRWERSLLATDGRRMFCHFRAPDAESARIALRESGDDVRVLWPGTVHDKPGLDAAQIASANVLVERRFAVSTALEEIQAIEGAGSGCLEARNVSFLRTLHSLDRQRMICLYRAPDAESVRQAQREAGVPFADAWACSAIFPD